MDPSLIITAITTLLKPLLQKAGETAATTIGERIGNTTVEKSTWDKIKGLFVSEDEQLQIKAIEDKSISTDADIKLLENKLTDAVEKDPDFAVDIQSVMQITPNNSFLIEQYAKSIQADEEKFAELMEDRRLAGIETEDQYELQIKKVLRRMEKDRKKILQLIQNT